MYSKKYSFEECRLAILKLLERYSSCGTLNTCGEVKDIEARMTASINVHLRKLYSEFIKETKKCTLVLCPPKVKFSFGPMELSGENNLFTGYYSGENMAFYIRMCGTGQVVIYMDDDSKRYASQTAVGETTVIKGSIETGGEMGRILVAGEPWLSVEEFVMYDDGSAIVYPSELMEADGTYGVYLPCDCARVVGIYDFNGVRMNIPEECFSGLEGVFKVPKGMCGEYILEYEAYPEQITQGDEDKAQIILPGVLFDALCYMCAADLCPSADGETYAKLTYKYREILDNLYSRAELKCKNSFFSIKNDKLHGLIRRAGK